MPKSIDMNIRLEGIAPREMDIVAKQLAFYGFDMTLGSNPSASTPTFYRPDLIDKSEFKSAVVEGTNEEETEYYGGVVWGRIEELFKDKLNFMRGRVSNIGMLDFTPPVLELFGYGAPHSKFAQSWRIYNYRSVVANTFQPTINWLETHSPKIENKYSRLYFNDRAMSACQAAAGVLLDQEQLSNSSIFISKT